METRIAELRYKEVISVTDGSRFGYVGDMEVDLESGQVRALVVPGRLRLFGLLGREEDLSLIHIWARAFLRRKRERWDICCVFICWSWGWRQPGAGGSSAAR